VPLLLSDFIETLIFSTNFSAVYPLFSVLKKHTTFIALDLFLERKKWDLFTLLPEVGSRSGW
jgi:hypothetical protein